MFSITTNIFIFIVYILLLVTEFIFLRIFDIQYSPAWMLTTLFYIAVIAYQVLIKTSEYLDRTKVRDILIRIMDTISGIPLVNKNDKIIIKWDIIFKKLIDKKEFELYDSIMKIKTKTIDYYVNQYPSLLFDNSTRIVEGNQKIDLNTVVGGRTGSSNELKLPDISEEIAKRLYIKQISNDKVTFTNYDSSVLVDVVINDEFEPQDYERLEVIPDKRYDGFSVVAYYKDKKYVIVNRTMVFNKRIEKEKWLYRNVERLALSVQSIINGSKEYSIHISDADIADYLSDLADVESESVPFFRFECINEEDCLVFSSFDKGKILYKAYCSITSNHTGFEIKLLRYDIITNGGAETIEEEKTIAIGSSYQPLITIMEKMPVIVNNLRLAISNKDIENIVIK